MDKLFEFLFHKNVTALKFACESLQCDPVKEGKLYKADYVKSLIEWVSVSLVVGCPT